MEIAYHFYCGKTFILLLEEVRYALLDLFRLHNINHTLVFDLAKDVMHDSVEMSGLTVCASKLLFVFAPCGHFFTLDGPKIIVKSRLEWIEILLIRDFLCYKKSVSSKKIVNSRLIVKSRFVKSRLDCI